MHRLERLTHAGESLLVELRDGRRTMDQRTTDVLLAMVDRVRDLLTAIERDGTVVAREYDSYLTFDIGANYALTDKVLLSAAVYNVGDEQLEPDAYNTVGDGRRFWLGTTIKF